jgi:predicted N-acyltransferase
LPDQAVIVDSIAKLPREDWNALARNDVYGQYGWLKTVEASVAEARQPSYILLYRQGHPLAAAALYEYARSTTSGRLTELLYGRAATLATRLRLAPQKTLYCGPIIGQGRHIFWDKNCNRDEAADRIRAVLDIIRKRLAAESVPVVFGRIPAEEAGLVRALRDFGAIESRTWPISYIDLEWDTFDDYLKSLARFGKNMRTKARREIAAPDRHGIEIQSVSNFENDAAEIDEMFRRTQSKYGPGPTPFDRTLIGSLLENGLDRPIVNIARSRDGGSMAGCALLLRAGNTAAGPLIGVDDAEANRKAFTYFNLSLYTPIRYCLANDVSRIFFGSGLGRMKQKRGCRQMDVFVFVLAPGRISRLIWKCWMWLHLKWIARKSAREFA